MCVRPGQIVNRTVTITTIANDNYVRKAKMRQWRTESPPSAAKIAAGKLSWVKRRERAARQMLNDCLVPLAPDGPVDYERVKEIDALMTQACLSYRPGVKLAA